MHRASNCSPVMVKIQRLIKRNPGRDKALPKPPRVRRRISIATRLYFVVGLMGLLIFLELLTLRFAMGKLSAVARVCGRRIALVERAKERRVQPPALRHHAR